MIEIWQILLSLVITLLFETFVYMFLKPKSLKLLITVVGINIILNVTMNFTMKLITNETAWYIVLAIWEIGTTIIEATIIYMINKFKYWKTILFAIAANLISLVVGVSLWPFEQQKTTVIVLTIVFGSLFLIEFIIHSVLCSMKIYKESK